ncbi:MAG TPA: UDP-glucose 4-epimerase GalE [Patescibacteria group bacterium]|nr:UDP-glucose 4-epimerase GalE [Patescibacteria group bacterium]
MSAILVTGGAGYVGSHACKALAAAGYHPVVFDNLSAGHRWAVRWGPLEVGDLADTESLRRVIRRHRIEAIMHFAAASNVSESMREPGYYYRNNVCGSLNLLTAMSDCGVSRLVFSSTCASYGLPRAMPISESHPQWPITPYGDTKFAIERMLHWWDQVHGIRSFALRYFNAAGADLDGEIGEAHTPETHLIPIALEVAQRPRAVLDVYGDDYPTADGTAVRDYIHVSDLADAHVAALGRLYDRAPSLAVNLGTGVGLSVRQVIDAIERTIGRSLPTRIGPRRAGDPPQLIADPRLAFEVLNWTPHRSDIDTIVGSAWAWACSREDRQVAHHTPYPPHLKRPSSAKWRPNDPSKVDPVSVTTPRLETPPSIDAS